MPLVKVSAWKCGAPPAAGPRPPQAREPPQCAAAHARPSPVPQLAPSAARRRLWGQFRTLQLQPPGSLQLPVYARRPRELVPRPRKCTGCGLRGRKCVRCKTGVPQVGAPATSATAPGSPSTSCKSHSSSSRPGCISDPSHSAFKAMAWVSNSTACGRAPVTANVATQEGEPRQTGKGAAAAVAMPHQPHSAWPTPAQEPARPVALQRCEPTAHLLRLAIPPRAPPQLS